MGGKNEILLSIALEGDDEVKSKLDGVAESGKKLGHSFGEVGRGASEAGEKLLGKLGEPLGKLKEAFDPLLEEAGLGRLGGLVGGGLIGRLLGAAGPAAAFAALSGIALHMAKVSEETDKTKSKFKALGAEDGLEKLKEQANKLGVSPETLQPSLEQFAKKRNEFNADQSSGVIRLRPNGATEADEAAAGVSILGGSNAKGRPFVKDETFIAALDTLGKGAQAQKLSAEEAGKIQSAFTGKLLETRKLTPEAVDTLNPANQNILAKSLSSFFGGTVQNGAELKERLGRPGQVAPTDSEVFRALQKAEPEANTQAEAAHGVTAGFDKLAASAARLDEVFGKVAGGPINKALTEGLDKVAGGIDKAADLVEHNKGAIDKGAEIGGKVGSHLPIPFGKQLGSVVGGIEGGIVGVGSDYLKEQGQEIAEAGARATEGLPSWLKNALSNPAALGPDETIPHGGPSALTPEGLAATKIPNPLDSVSRSTLTKVNPLLGAAAILPELFGLSKEGASEAPAQQPLQQPSQQPPPAPPQQGDTNPAYNWPIAPARPTEQPPQPAPAQPEPATPAAFLQGPLPPQPPSFIETIAGAITPLLNSLHDRMVGPENNRIDGPVDGLGLRGDASPQGEAPTQNVAALDGAAGGAAEGLRQVASAAPAAADKLSNSGDKSAPTENVTAKDGGFIHRFDEGGAVRGPGTSTSDDIPARLSDGEYVVNARETGRNRGALDAINGGNFTKAISRMFARGGAVQKFADGGTVAPMGTSSVAASYDPDSGGVVIDGVKHSASDPDPVVQAVLKNAKAEYDQEQAKWQAEQKKIKATRHKSDFVGFFGSSSTYEDQQHQAGSQLDPFADGGIVQRHAIGGPISGPGTSTSDDIPAYLSHGEFVVNARETGRNLSALHAINGGRFSEHLSKMFASGGLVDVPHFADGGHAGGLSGIAPGPAPSTGDISSSGADMSGYHHVDMRTDFGNFRMMAPEHVARSMSAAARDSANAQTGQRPSWYRGR